MRCPICNKEYIPVRSISREMCDECYYFIFDTEGYNIESHEVDNLLDDLGEDYEE